MSDLYNNFENRFKDAWFSSGWVEVEAKPQEIQAVHKDLTTLENELKELKNTMENITQKQLRLANLAKFYQN
ncbi:MAG: hypothetical protein WCG95_06255 [bacterium]